MMIKNKKILSWFALPALAFTVSCSDDLNINDTTGTGEGDNVLTIMVEQQPQSLPTRADEEPHYHISDGKKVDVLVFAVYESEDGINYKLAESFQKEGMETKGRVARGKGQNLLDVPDDWANHPMRIMLVTNPNYYYKVAFWAQNSKFGGFDTRDLAKVRVIYPGQPSSGSEGTDTPETAAETTVPYEWLNNDEAGDAFCRTLEIKPNPVGAQHVVLRRPLAQINVATSGWDYEGAEILTPNPTKYMWSEIKIKNVAQYYDVIEGKSITSENGKSLLTDVYFEYSYMPAFYQYTSKNQSGSIPSLDAKDVTNDELLKVKRGKFANIDYVFNKKTDGFYYDYLSWHRYFNFKGGTSDDLDSEDYVEDDQFYGKYYSISVDPDGVEKIEEVDPKAEGFNPENYYTSSQLYEYLNNKEEADPKIIASEIYKYLSMCYILVPDGTDEKGDPTSSTVDVEFRYKGKNLTTNTTTGSEGDKATEWFKINNVPVQKNFRTNIIGDGFFVYSQGFNVFVIPDYCGEYDYGFDAGNNADDDQKWLWGTDDAFTDKDQDNWGLKPGTGFIYDDFNIKFGKEYK